MVSFLYCRPRSILSVWILICSTLCTPHCACLSSTSSPISPLSPPCPYCQHLSPCVKSKGIQHRKSKATTIKLYNLRLKRIKLSRLLRLFILSLSLSPHMLLVTLSPLSIAYVLSSFYAAVLLWFNFVFLALFALFVIVRSRCAVSAANLRALFNWFSCRKGISCVSQMKHFKTQ